MLKSAQNILDEVDNKLEYFDKFKQGLNILNLIQQMQRSF